MGEQTSILDQIIETQEIAKEKLASGKMLLPEEEKHLKQIITPVKRSTRRKINMPKKPMKTEASDLVTELASEFNPELPTKKGIRTLRKALQALSLERFPKKAKKAKEEPKDKDESES